MDADVDEKQVMKLVQATRRAVVEDCAVVLFGLCEACCETQMHEKHSDLAENNGFLPLARTAQKGYTIRELL